MYDFLIVLVTAFHCRGFCSLVLTWKVCITFEYFLVFGFKTVDLKEHSLLKFEIILCQKLFSERALFISVFITLNREFFFSYFKTQTKALLGSVLIKDKFLSIFIFFIFGFDTRSNICLILSFVCHRRFSFPFNSNRTFVRFCFLFFNSCLGINTNQIFARGPPTQSSWSSTSFHFADDETTFACPRSRSF